MRTVRLTHTHARARTHTYTKEPAAMVGDSGAPLPLPRSDHSHSPRVSGSLSAKKTPTVERTARCILIPAEGFSASLYPAKACFAFFSAPRCPLLFFCAVFVSPQCTAHLSRCRTVRSRKCHVGFYIHLIYLTNLTATRTTLFMCQFYLL